METEILSRLSEKCAKCQEVETCEHKILEHCAYAINNRLIEPICQDMTSPCSLPILKEVDLRHIKVAEDTFVTIDLVKLKEQNKLELIGGIYGNNKKR